MGERLVRQLLLGESIDEPGVDQCLVRPACSAAGSHTTTPVKSAPRVSAPMVPPASKSASASPVTPDSTISYSPSACTCSAHEPSLQAPAHHLPRARHVGGCSRGALLHAAAVSWWRPGWCRGPAARVGMRPISTRMAWSTARTSETRGPSCIEGPASPGMQLDPRTGPPAAPLSLAYCPHAIPRPCPTR